MTTMNDQYRILIVDDTPENIDILANVLKPQYKRAAALNGNRALEIAGSDNPPDLILLDIMMPDMDGYEVCRRLKADERTRDIPVIFITAKTEVRDETRGFEVGAVDYITKPISPPIVLARVKTHLELRQARRVLEEQNQELIEAAKLREDVDHIMRHDLKGPLTSIIGMPQLIRMDADLKPSHLRALKYIEESGYIMLRMINLSLDLFKMERGIYVFNPQPVDLIKTFRKVFSDQETLAKMKHITMVLSLDGRPVLEDELFTVLADELLAFSMFSNLVKNAVEASPEGGPVSVNFDGLPEMGQVTISNQGAVPAAIRERFFDKFVTAGKEGGSGLGTYSARLMAETMKGSIELESDLEEVTRLVVCLPMA